MSVKKPDSWLLLNGYCRCGCTDPPGLSIYASTFPAPKQRFALDFNKAYNPYCAYDEHWACPLPPSENHTPAAIRAGMLYTPVP